MKGYRPRLHEIYSLMALSYRLVQQNGLHTDWQSCNNCSIKPMTLIAKAKPPKPTLWKPKINYYFVGLTGTLLPYSVRSIRALWGRRRVEVWENRCCVNCPYYGKPNTVHCRNRKEMTAVLLLLLNPTILILGASSRGTCLLFDHLL